MRAHKLSASKVDLAEWCTYSFRVDVDLPEKQVGPKAVIGTEVHKAAERWFRKEQVGQISVDASSLWASLKSWLEDEVIFSHSEIAILYDATTDTAQVCETGNGERDYLNVSQYSLPMRLDLVREGTQLEIVDIKTGSMSNAAPPPENAQLFTQALGASRLLGYKTAHVGLVFPLKTKVHEPVYHHIDEHALDAHAGKIRRILRTIPDSQPVRGPHCWKCSVGPGKGFVTQCPAWLTDQT